MADKKYFVLMKGGADTGQVFASRQPRGAALKAATRGATEIRLRERGTRGYIALRVGPRWWTSRKMVQLGCLIGSRRPMSVKSESNTFECSF